ncbi:hypothetical protein AAC387_Pa07g1200 [Persea americana]
MYVGGRRGIVAVGWRRGLQEGCLGGPRGVLHHPGEAGDGEALVGGVKVSGVRSRPPGHQGREGFPPRDAGSDIGRRHEEEEAVEARWNCPTVISLGCNRCADLATECIFSNFTLLLTQEPIEEPDKIYTGTIFGKDKSETSSIGGDDKEEDEDTIDFDDQLYFPAEEKEIDISKNIRDLIHIEITITALCDPRCKGLCLQCGTNLSKSTCNCSKKEVDDEESSPWDGAVVYKRDASVAHVEYCTTLERLGMEKLSSEASRSRASDLGLRVTKAVKDFPLGTPVQISVDVTRKKKQLKLDGIVPLSSVSDAIGVLQPSDRIMVLCSNWKCPLVSRSEIDKWIRPPVRGFLPLSGIQDHSRDRAHQTQAIVQCADLATECIFSNFTLLLTQEPIEEPDKIYTGTIFGKDKSETSSIGGDDKEEDEDTIDFDDQLYFPAEEKEIDISKNIRDLIHIEITITALCDPRCKGLCLQCGTNLSGRRGIVAVGWRRGLQEGCLGGPRGVLHHPGEAGDGEALVGGVKVSGVRSRPPGHQGREGFPPRDAGSDIGRRHEEEEAVEARWNCPTVISLGCNRCADLATECIFSNFTLLLTQEPIEEPDKIYTGTIFGKDKSETSSIGGDDKEEDEDTIDFDDQLYFPAEEKEIDISKNIRDLIHIEITITALCDPRCKGLCLQCGTNLSKSTCNCSKKEVDDEESSPWDGAVVYKRDASVAHVEYCTTLERLGMEKLSSEASRSRASDLGLRVTKAVKDFPLGTPVQISVDVTRKKKQLKLDGIVPLSSVSDAIGVLQPSDRIMVLCSNWKCPLVSRSEIDKWIRPPVRGFLPLSGIQDHSRDRAHQTQAIVQCADLATECIFSNFTLLLTQEPIEEPDKIYTGTIFGKDKSETSSIGGDDKEEDEDTIDFDDQLYFPAEEKEIDISKNIRDLIHIEITITALCDPRCKGLCLQCGTNLSKSTCNCSKKEVDDEESSPWDGAVVYKRDASVAHVEYCTTLERLGMEKLSSEASRSRASDLGLRVTKAVKDFPLGTPVQISVDVTRKKKQLKLDGIVPLSSVSDAIGVLQPSDRIMVLCSNWKCPLVSRSEIDKWIRPPVRGFLPLSGIQDHSRDRAHQTQAIVQCADLATECIFSNFTLLLTQEPIEEPDKIYTGTIFGKDKSETSSIGGDDKEEDEDTIDFDDQLYFPAEEKEIDISKNIRDLIHIEITITALCDPRCKGLCLQCGTNLSKSTCNCSKKEVDDEESSPWDGAVVYKRDASVAHVEYCTTLERLGMEKLSSEASRSRASDLGLRVTKAVKDFPLGTPVQISVDVTRKKKQLKLDGIVPLSSVSDAIGVLQPSDRIMVLCSNWKCPLVSRSEIDKWIRPPVRGFLPLSGIQDHSRDRAHQTQAIVQCADLATECIFSNFTLLLTQEPIEEPDKIYTGTIFGKDKSETSSIGGDDKEEDEDTIDFDDQLYFPAEEKEIDISKNIRDLIHIEITITALCDPRCKGLCLQCGTNLSKSTCNCSKKEVDDEESSPWDGAVVYKRDASVAHVEYCTTLERLGMEKLSSEASRSRASDLGLRVTKAVKDFPLGTPVQISVDVTRKKKQLKLDGIVPLSSVSDAIGVLQPSDRIMVLCSNWKCPLVSRSEIDKWIRPPVRGFLPLSGIQDHSRDRAHQTQAIVQCADLATECIFSNFTLLLTQEPIEEPDKIYTGTIFGKDKSETSSIGGDDKEEDEDTIDFDDQLYFPAEEKEIDISKNIRDLIHIEITITALCDPRCKGLCLQCGTNLSKSTCNCSKKEVKNDMPSASVFEEAQQLFSRNRNPCTKQM